MLLYNVSRHVSRQPRGYKYRLFWWLLILAFRLLHNMSNHFELSQLRLLADVIRSRVWVGNARLINLLINTIAPFGRDGVEQTLVVMGDTARVHYAKLYLAPKWTVYVITCGVLFGASILAHCCRIGYVIA